MTQKDYDRIAETIGGLAKDEQGKVAFEHLVGAFCQVFEGADDAFDRRPFVTRCYAAPKDYIG